MTKEINCDESGYEGEKLIDTTTAVFAHSSLHLRPDVAAGCLAELRARIRSPATQYKANHLLREKNRATLEWFLGPASPVHDNGRVFLIDKAWFLAGRLAELLRVDPAELYGQSAYVLAAGNDLLRVKDRPGV